MNVANLELRQDFAADFEVVTAGLQRDYSGPPYAFVRFADGEAALMRGEHHRSRSDSWSVSGAGVPSVVDGLHLAIQCDLPGWHVGVTAASHHREDHRYLVRESSSPPSRTSFAELFIFGNYERFRLIDTDHCRVVGAGARKRLGRRGYHIPPDAVERDDFDLEPVITWMLRGEGPILLAAGPLANLLAFEYWRTGHWLGVRREVCIDVGSAIAPRVRGRATRRYHHPESDLRRHVPTWGSFE